LLDERERLAHSRESPRDLLRARVPQAAELVLNVQAGPLEQPLPVRVPQPTTRCDRQPVEVVADELLAWRIHALMIHLYRPVEESARRMDSGVIDFMINGFNETWRAKGGPGQSQDRPSVSRPVCDRGGLDLCHRRRPGTAPGHGHDD